MRKANLVLGAVAVLLAAQLRIALADISAGDNWESGGSPKGAVKKAFKTASAFLKKPTIQGAILVDVSGLAEPACRLVPSTVETAKQVKLLGACFKEIKTTQLIEGFTSSQWWLLDSKNDISLDAGAVAAKKSFLELTKANSPTISFHVYHSAPDFSGDYYIGLSSKGKIVALVASTHKG